MFCRNCGNRLGENAKFCVQCGSPVPQETTVEELTPAPEEIPVEENVSATADEEVVAEQTVESEDVAAEDFQQETTTESEIVPEDAVVSEQEPTKENIAEEEFLKFEDVVEQETYTQEPLQQTVALNGFAIANEDIADEVMTDDMPSDDWQPSPEALIYEQESISASVSSLKKSLGSVLVIVAIVVYMAMLVMQVFGALNPSRTDLVGAIEFMGGDLGNFEDYIQFVVDYAAVFLCVALIPTLLIMIGMWINVTQSFRKNGFASAGFGVIKVSLIIKIVLSALGLVASITAMFVAVPIINDAIRDAAGDGDVTVLPFVVLGVIAAFSAVILTHSIIAMVSCGKMNKVLTLNNKKPKGFMALCVMNYIMVAVNVIKLGIMIFLAVANNVIVEFFNKMDMLPHSFRHTIEEIIEDLCEPNIYNMVAVVLGAAAYILFSINIRKYAKSLKLHKN